MKLQEEVLAKQTATDSLPLAEQPHNKGCCPLAVRYSTLYCAARDPQSAQALSASFIDIIIVVVIIYYYYYCYYYDDAVFFTSRSSVSYSVFAKFWISVSKF